MDVRRSGLGQAQSHHSDHAQTTLQRNERGVRHREIGGEFSRGLPVLKHPGGNGIVPFVQRQRTARLDLQSIGAVKQEHGRLGVEATPHFSHYFFHDLRKRRGFGQFARQQIESSGAAFTLAFARFLCAQAGGQLPKDQSYYKVHGQQHAILKASYAKRENGREEKIIPDDGNHARRQQGWAAFYKERQNDYGQQGKQGRGLRTDQRSQQESSQSNRHDSGDHDGILQPWRSRHAAPQRPSRGSTFQRHDMHANIAAATNQFRYDRVACKRLPPRRRALFRNYNLGDVPRESHPQHGVR